MDVQKTIGAAITAIGVLMSIYLLVRFTSSSDIGGFMFGFVLFLFALPLTIVGGWLWIRASSSGEPVGLGSHRVVCTLLTIMALVMIFYFISEMDALSTDRLRYGTSAEKQVNVSMFFLLMIPWTGFSAVQLIRRKYSGVVALRWLSAVWVIGPVLALIGVLPLGVQSVVGRSIVALPIALALFLYTFSLSAQVLRKS